MGYVVRMPQLGMSMDEGTLLEWRVGEGEAVQSGDVLAVVESEKTSADVESREDGSLRRVLVSEGVTVAPGDPIGVVAGPDEDASAVLEDAGAPADGGAAAGDTAAERPTGAGGTPADGSTGADPTAESDSTGNGAAASDADVRATPGARRRAEREGVALAGVEGTGPQGVVTEGDVARAAEAGASAGAATRTVAETVELTGVQRTTADRLAESYREAVHVTVRRTVDATPAQDVLAAARAAGVDASLADLLLCAFADALEAHPRFNATFADDRYEVFEEVNVGYAVDVDGDLRTPVVPDVGASSVEDVAARRRDLVSRAQAGDLSVDDEAGGTVTVTNLGPLGVDSFDPVINPPEVAILGVGRVRDGEVTLSLAFDHRVRNGADAARLLDALASNLTDRERLRSHVETAIAAGPDRRTAVARVTEGYAGTYRTAAGEVAFDEPEAVGGEGRAPDPVEHLLGALGACLTVSVREMADRDGVGLEDVETRVAGSPETGPLDAVEVTVTVASPAGDDAIDRVVEKAERACYVARALDVDAAVSWERRA
ncbi:MAG: 2-oxo acid dehydrogenase subunit E2 [Halobacteriaceae archaeon]